jgi:hypothetical protein
MNTREITRRYRLNNGLNEPEKAPTPYPVIRHAMASPATVAWVSHQKFVNAMPLYHQEKNGKCLVFISAVRPWRTV